MDGKGGKGKGHIILFRAGAHCARVLQLQLQFGKRAYDICVQDADGKRARSARDEDRMRTKGKQWVTRRKTMLYGRENGELERRKKRHRKKRLKA